MKRDDQYAICLAAFIAELQDYPSGATGDIRKADMWDDTSLKELISGIQQIDGGLEILIRWVAATSASQSATILEAEMLPSTSKISLIFNLWKKVNKLTFLQRR